MMATTYVPVTRPTSAEEDPRSTKRAVANLTMTDGTGGDVGDAITPKIKNMLYTEVRTVQITAIFLATASVKTYASLKPLT